MGETKEILVVEKATLQLTIPTSWSQAFRGLTFIGPMIDGYRESRKRGKSFFERAGEVLSENITDISGVPRKDKLTIFDEYLLFNYRLGFLGRGEEKTIVLPLECAKSVEKAGWANKILKIEFDIPKQKEKTMDLATLKIWSHSEDREEVFEALKQTGLKERE